MLPPMVSQRILTYFVRGSISCFDYVYSTTDLLVQPNPNQSNRRSAVQLYFHLQSKWMFSGWVFSNLINRKLQWNLDPNIQWENILLLQCLLLSSSQPQQPANFASVKFVAAVAVAVVWAASVSLRGRSSGPSPTTPPGCSSRSRPIGWSHGCPILKPDSLKINLRIRPWSSLVEGDEQMNRPKVKKVWNVAMHALHILLVFS